MKQKIDQLNIDDFIAGNENVYVADLILDKNEKTNAHCHNFYEFFFCIEGAFIEKNNEKKYRIEEKGLHYIMDTDVHYFVGKENNNVLRNIAIRKSFIDKQFSRERNFIDLLYKRVISLNKIVYENLLYKSNHLMADNGSKESQEFIVNSMLRDIMIEGMKEPDEQIPYWLVNACKWVEEEDNYLLGLENFIRKSGKSQEHLGRELRKHYGLTTTEYINELRLKSAARKLIATESKILNISIEVGFSSLSYFNKQFKKYFGMTPSRYRYTNTLLFKK